MIKNRKKISLLSIFVIILGLMLWEIWPKKGITEELVYGPTELYFPQLKDYSPCGIQQAEWKIQYPGAIDFGESITIHLTSDALDGTKFDQENEICREIVIITRAEFPGAYVQPGELIYSPLDISKGFENTWYIYKDSEDKISGKIWIYIQAEEYTDLENAIPLFVVPVTINVRTIFGTVPRYVRIPLIIILMFLALIIMRFMK